MSEPDFIFGLPKDEFYKWCGERAAQVAYERLHFEKGVPLPDDMEVPPDWVRKANQQLALSLTRTLEKAIKGIHAEAKDYYSWGVLMGSLHAFREQISGVLKNAGEEYRKTLGTAKDAERAFVSSLAPDEYWGMGQWKARLFFVRLKLMLMASFIQSSGQARDLHKGYLKGLEFKIEQDASPMEKKAILGMLCTAWPLVVECDNVADLNRQLNAMLRYESVIDPQAKRLAGICREIGLKLADRGRPKNT